MTMPSSTNGAPTRKPVTLRELNRRRRDGERFACLTCYDATTARWLERAGIPVLLVGDTAAEMILGYQDTIHAPLDFLVMLTAAVKRGAPISFVMADMPFLSYQVDEADAIRNAGRFMTEGNADAVKFEVDGSFAPLVEKLTRACIPVVAHIGCRPQSVKQSGGYAIAGRTAETARILLDDALALERAGAVMLLIEATPNEVARRIVDAVGIPVIGCGAGAACHGDIVVLQDLLGMTDWQPSFAAPMAHLGEELMRISGKWITHVSSGADAADHPYVMHEGEAEQLDSATT